MTKQYKHSHIDLKHDWVLETFGRETMEYIRECAIEESDGFMRVLKGGIEYTYDEDVDIIAFRHVIPTPSPTRRSPRSKDADEYLPYWEGKLANGSCVRLDETDVEDEVREFYNNAQQLRESDSNGFVAVSKKMDVPTFPVEKTLPILSVLFEPEKAMKCNKTTPLVRGSRRIDYHVEMKKLQGTLPKNVKELGDDSNYEYRFLPPVWRVKLSDNTTAFSNKKKIVDLFGAPFATEVEYRGHVGKRYIHIPVGATREERLPFITSLQQSDAPTIQFMQGEFDTCIYSSFASALHYLGGETTCTSYQSVCSQGCWTRPLYCFPKIGPLLEENELGFLTNTQDYFNYRLCERH